MLREVSARYCDRCGREIVGYLCRRGFVTIDELGDYYMEGTDFCGACALSYEKWIKLGKDSETIQKERQYAREYDPNIEKAYDEISVRNKKERDHYLSEDFEV